MYVRTVLYRGLLVLIIPRLSTNIIGMSACKCTDLFTLGTVSIPMSSLSLHTYYLFLIFNFPLSFPFPFPHPTSTFIQLIFHTFRLLAFYLSLSFRFQFSKDSELSSYNILIVYFPFISRFSPYKHRARTPSTSFSNPSSTVHSENLRSYANGFMACLVQHLSIVVDAARMVAMVQIPKQKMALQNPVIICTSTTFQKNHMQISSSFTRKRSRISRVSFCTHICCAPMEL